MTSGARYGTAGEPVAVVGMACRLPGGVESPEGLWRVVAEARDVIGPLPTDRGWDGSVDALHGAVREGGFLDDPAGFDADFFGMTDREARAADPRLRLLLETSWEAVERAGIAPGSLRESRTGVFVGVEMESGSHLTDSDTSGRVAAVLGLAGPVLDVGTGSSSSLVALHEAVRALRAGECELTLVGGAAVLSSPGSVSRLARGCGLAGDARARAFAAAADGTSLGEGVGMLLLERLSDARRGGRRVLAVVRGTAVGEDGAESGPVAPGGSVQSRVIQQALDSAGLAPSDVDAVEAHGAGTRLGDSVEAQALLAAYGRGRQRPLFLGALKADRQHAQAAAGVTGVIKTVKAMEHGILPGTVPAGIPIPRVNWAAGQIQLLTESCDWPDTGRPRRAGVSAFDVGGIHAHVILEQPERHADSGPPAETDQIRTWPTGVPWVLSGHSADALRAQAERLAAHVVERPELTRAEVGAGLARGRSVFGHRAVVLGNDRAELLVGLAALAAGRPSPAVFHGRVTTDRRTVLVLSDRGLARDIGWAARLVLTSPVFSRRLAECQRALAAAGDHALRGGAFPGARPTARWAVLVALAGVWLEYGIRPAAVIGEGVGEIAAACVSGVLSLAEGALVVARGGSLSSALDGGDGGSSGHGTGTPPDVDRISLSLTSSSPLEDTVRTLSAHGHTLYVEVGAPSAVAPRLTAALEGHTARVVGSPVGGASGADRLLRELARLHVSDTTVTWPAAFRDPILADRPPADLPTYAFQRRRYGREDGERALGSAGSDGLVTDPHRSGTEDSPDRSIADTPATPVTTPHLGCPTLALAEVARLEAFLTSFAESADAETRQTVARRLRDLVNRWSGELHTTGLTGSALAWPGRQHLPRGGKESL